MNYQVKLNNGESIDLKNTAINVEALTTTLNDQRTAFINIGSAVISKHTITGVFPKEIVKGGSTDENKE